jgi:uncharacterized protein (DUF58 family)
MEQNLDELLARAKRLEVKARHLARSQFAGLYRSAFRGQGMEFAEVREYCDGDEIRLIDWNVSARAQSLYVKRMAEERERNVLLVLDTSGSLRFGTRRRTKFDLLQEVASLLALACAGARDRVSLALVRSRIEYYVPAAKGSNHTARVVREIAGCRAEGKGENLEPLWDFLNSAGVPRSLVFLFTDFEAAVILSNSLAAACRKHELVAVLASDPREWSLPKVGRVRVRDPETGAFRILNTSDSRLRREFEERAAIKRASLLKVLRGGGATSVELQTDQDYEPVLRRFLENRSLRR